MDRSKHTMACLFAQLGINNSAQQIESFINQHKGIAPDTPLTQAKIWNQSQAEFLKQAIEEDSDWSEVVDSLDSLLR